VPAGTRGTHHASRVAQVERSASHGGQRQQLREDGVEDLLRAAPVLQHFREVRHGVEAHREVVDDEHQDACPGGEREDDVEVVPPRRPRTARAQERVVEVVQPPEDERDGQGERARRAHLPPVSREHPSGP
jgi:hypothetical protein